MVGIMHHGLSSGGLSHHPWRVAWQEFTGAAAAASRLANDGW